ncbi:MAG: hypothetical protein KBS81_00110, partial [Spirochaetales bacterium]|nr:hypothetical protein [Candidatus Physcosoma equi]
MKISVKSCDNGKARAINERYGISLLASTVMARRGVDEEDVKYFLEEELVYQHSPFTVDDVYTAVERIEEALDTEDGEDQERIIIYGDRDVDGMTSTAIMYRTLKKLGAKYVTTRLPHGDESYGLTPEIVKEIIDGGHTLCITVDNGISAIDEIRDLEMS